MKLSVFYEHIKEGSAQSGIDEIEVLKRVKGFGIDAVDIECWRIDEDKNLKDKLEKAEIKVASVYKFFDFGHIFDESEVRNFIDRAKYVGADKVLCIPGFVNNEDDINTVNENIVNELLNLCDYAEENGITVTLEDFDSSTAPYSTIDGLIWFMERVPKLRFTFDSGNFLFSEIDELSAFEQLSSKIVHIHLKDRSLSKTADSFTETIAGKKLYPSSVGAGCIKIAECLKKLKAINYNGYYTIEHFGAENQLDYIEKSARFIRENI